MCVIILLYFPQLYSFTRNSWLSVPALPVRVRSALFVLSARLWSCTVSFAIVCVREVKERVSEQEPPPPPPPFPLCLPPCWFRSSFPHRSETRRHLRSLRKLGGSDKSLSRAWEKKSSRTKRLSVHVERPPPALNCIMHLQALGLWQFWS